LVIILKLIGIVAGCAMVLFAVSQREKRPARRAQRRFSSAWDRHDGPRGALQKLVGPSLLWEDQVRDDYYPFDLWHVGPYRGRTIKLRVAHQSAWELAIYSRGASNEVLEPDQQEFAALSAELCSSPQSSLEAHPEAEFVKLRLEEPFSSARLEELAPPLRRLIQLLEQGRCTRATVVEREAAPRLTSEREAELRCPYCHDGLQSAEVISCTDCATQHHLACYTEAGCTVLGCRGATRTRPPASPTRLAA
jgi:hypothetical protein